MKLYVGGFGARGGGYPNAERTLTLLRTKLDIEVIELGGWFPQDFHLWKLMRARAPLALWRLMSLFLSNARSAICIFFQVRRNSDWVYVPYPSIFFLFIFSFVPKKLRPYCIADAYISIWDSLAKDRSVASGEGIGVRWLKKCEARALRAAAMVLVDTEANRDMFIAEFGLEREKVRSVPLAIDEVRFMPADMAEPPRKRLRILFVGTLIPLHGVENILDAFRLLARDERFEFCLIGEGQQSHLVDRFSKHNPQVRLEWIREWCSLDRLASEIAKADVCLGVFGGVGKAARVLPLKLYMYLASGKVIVTQPNYSLPSGCPLMPVVTAVAGEEIADAVNTLAADPERCVALEKAARAYYLKFLSNSELINRWVSIIKADLRRADNPT